MTDKPCLLQLSANNKIGLDLSEGREKKKSLFSLELFAKTLSHSCRLAIYLPLQ